MTVFDEAQRPRLLKPDAPADPLGEHGARTLQAIHDHLRHELAMVVRAVQQAVGDTRRAADARALLAGSTMTRNVQALGSFCGRYCSVVDVHHRIEDAATFPDLRAADPSLAPVLDRLSEEHVVVHGHLVAVDAALVALQREEDGAVERLGEAVAVLDEGLRSHLDYEEDELLPALRRLPVLV